MNDSINSHYIPITAIGGLATAQVAAENHVPLSYYVATLTVLGLIVTVVKTYSWVETKMKGLVDSAFIQHNKLDEERMKRMEERLAVAADRDDERGARIEKAVGDFKNDVDAKFMQVRDTLLAFPCVRGGQGCEAPTFTPLPWPGTTPKGT